MYSYMLLPCPVKTQTHACTSELLRKYTCLFLKKYTDSKLSFLRDVSYLRYELF